LILILIPR